MHPAKVRQLAAAVGVALPFVLHSSSLGGLHASTGATLTTPTTASAIEWDLPTEIDFLPGAIVTDKGDGNRLWFVTRFGAPDPFVYRVDLKDGKKVNSAEFFGWPLDSTSLLASGLRRVNTSHDGRFVFVRTTFGLQRIDVGGCKNQASTYLTSPSVVCDRTVWDVHLTEPADPAADFVDGLTGSDLAIDEYRNSFSVFGVLGDQTSDPAQPIRSFIERLNPESGYDNVDRWYVGGNAGICNFASSSAPCLSGVAISPRAKNLVYYAEPTGGDGTGAIGELNPSTNTVRRWPFKVLNGGVTDPFNPDVVNEPRQIQFDSDGILWVVTGSGHLVSLDPKRNRLTKHATPGHAPAGTTTDTFGIAPDGGVIGYTDSHFDQNNVAMLLPKGGYVTFSPAPVKVVRRTFKNAGRTDPVERIKGSAQPIPRKYTVTRTPQGDGIFIEADTTVSLATPMTPSFSPTGITPDRRGSVGTFFYAIGDSGGLTNRFGRIRLPKEGIRGRVERDDDDCDDDGKRADADDDDDDDGAKDDADADDDNDGSPDGFDDDDDNDGIEDSFDTPNNKESKQTSSLDAVGGDSLMDEFTVNPGTVLAVVSATSTNALAPVSVEILNAAGQIVATSVSTPGAAVLTWIPPAAGGVFTVRVRNQSLSAATLSSKVLTRELWSLF